MTQEFLYKTLLDTMFASRANKRYGKDSIDFEVAWVPKLMRMIREVDDREFRVDENFAFLTSVPRWREIFATLAEGRIGDHLLCDTLSPYVERELHDRTFNNRIGKGMQAAVNQVIEDIAEVTCDYTKPARVMKWDLKGFFPNANCDYMQQCFDSVIDKYAKEIADAYGEEMPGLLHWLAMVLIHCCPAHHCTLRTPKVLWKFIEPEKSLFTKPEGIGVPIGRLSSQMGMGLYINDEVRWLNDECGIRTTVFMDDGVMVVPEEQHEFALSLIPQLRTRLQVKGVRLNEKKFYDQPWQHGLEFLGTNIRKGRLHLSDKTFGRCMERVDEFNRQRNKEQLIHKFISSANSYAGMLKAHSSHKRIERLREGINQEWMQYVEWDERRMCVVARPGYTERDILANKYNLKIKKQNDTVRKAAVAQ